MMSEEIFPIVDEEGNQISTALRSVCHDGKSMLLHPVVHFHLINERGEIFLQKRSMSKDLLPGRWDSAVGGHINPGETPEEALKRETEEELGIKIFSYTLNKKYVWISSLERELVYSFTGSSTDTPVVNRDEIDEGRFWSVEEIRILLGKEFFTPNFEMEFNTLLT
jgi:isopentenyldiphosphate isomerase